MQKQEYKTVQIPKDAYELLKAYCDATGLKMGMYVGKLIEANCVVGKKPGGLIMPVVNKEGGQ
jgi:hypothetical protein